MSSSECRVFLFRSWPGSMMMPLLRDARGRSPARPVAAGRRRPRRRRRRSAGAGTGVRGAGQAVRDHQRRLAVGDHARAISGSLQPGGVVDDRRAGLDAAPGHLRRGTCRPRSRRRMPRAAARDRPAPPGRPPRRPAAGSRARTAPRRCRPSRRRPSTAASEAATARSSAKVAPAVVEGVRRAVDDRHHRDLAREVEARGRRCGAAGCRSSGCGKLEARVHDPTLPHGHAAPARPPLSRAAPSSSDRRSGTSGSASRAASTGAATGSAPARLVHVPDVDVHAGDDAVRRPPRTR